MNSKKTVFHWTPDFRFSEEFDANKTWYYKEAPELKADNTDFINTFWWVSKGFSWNRPIYFTDNRNIASSYSQKPAYDYKNSIPAILERKLLMNKPLEIDAKWSLWRKFETTLEWIDIKWTRELEQFAKDRWYDWIIVKNVNDPYSTLEGKTREWLWTNYVVFSPDQIKTKSQLLDIYNKAHNK